VNVFNLVTANGWRSLADAPEASINEGGVLNAASYEVGAAVAPGSIAAVFGHFSRPGVRVYFPGAPFVLAAVLTLGCAVLFVRALRLPAAVAPALTVGSS
jgi:DHA1 family tetracycline resistance protein-like MFS transporter